MFSSRKTFATWFWTAYLILTSILMYESKKAAYRNSEKREAVVIDRLEARTSRGIAYYPQFQFNYNDSVYISADKLWLTSGKRPGAKLIVIFPNGSPGDAVIYTFVSYWISAPTLILSFLIAFFVFGMIIFFAWPDGWKIFERSLENSDE